MTQVAAQGSAKKETVSFENLLWEFLNMNQVAVEHGTKVFWEYDKQVWDKVSEKINRKAPDLDVREEFTVVDQNKLSEIKGKVHSGAAGRWGKGTAAFTKASGSGGGKGAETVKGGTWQPGKNGGKTGQTQQNFGKGKGKPAKKW